jgi:hypothetical protein
MKLIYKLSILIILFLIISSKLKRKRRSRSLESMRLLRHHLKNGNGNGNEIILDGFMNPYNIFLANPMKTNTNNEIEDPAFVKTMTIFSNTEQLSSSLSDYSYKFPKGYDVQPIENCRLAEVTKVYSTKKELYEEKVKGVNIYGQGSAARTMIQGTGKYDKESKAANTETTTQNVKYITTEAVCASFRVVFQEYSPPEVDSSFIDSLKQLNGKTFKKDPQSYYEFLKTHGTHYIREVFLGSKFSAIMEISSAEYSKIRTDGSKSEWSANYEMYEGIQNAYFEDQTDDDRQVSKTTEDNQNEEVENKKTTIYKKENMKFSFIGVKMKKDSKKWAELTRKEPKVVQYTLDSISNLLEIQAINKVFTQKGINNLNLISTGLRLATETFCSGYMLPRREIDVCVRSAELSVTEQNKGYGAATLNLDSNVNDLNGMGAGCQEGALNYFKLQYMDYDSYSYSYKCVKNPYIISSTDCIELSTNIIPYSPKDDYGGAEGQGEVEGGVYKKVLLSGVCNKVECPSGRVLQSFTHKTVELYSYYDYTCCKANIKPNTCNKRTMHRNSDKRGKISDLALLEFNPGAVTNLVVGFSYSYDKTNMAIVHIKSTTNYCSANTDIN